MLVQKYHAIRNKGLLFQTNELSELKQIDQCTTEILKFSTRLSEIRPIFSDNLPSFLLRVTNICVGLKRVYTLTSYVFNRINSSFRLSYHAEVTIGREALLNFRRFITFSVDENIATSLYAQARQLHLFQSQSNFLNRLRFINKCLMLFEEINSKFREYLTQISDCRVPIQTQRCLFPRKNIENISYKHPLCNQDTEQPLRASTK